MPIALRESDWKWHLANLCSAVWLVRGHTEAVATREAVGKSDQGLFFADGAVQQQAYLLAAVKFPLEIFHDFPNSTTDRGLWPFLVPK